MGSDGGSVRAELVAIGSELLLGDNVDTNTAWISARLAEIGVDVHRHATCGDNVGRMVEVLREAASRVDAVIVTGGLGPTADDLTRLAVAQVAGVELERDERLAEYLFGYWSRAGREMPESNLVQADLPAGARVLRPVGTAAGFAVDVGTSTIWCLPGVPAEMETMVERDVLPVLREQTGQTTTVSRVVRTAGMAESSVGEACAPLVERLEEAGNPTIAFLASRGETRVRVTAKAADRQAALKMLDPIVAEVVEGLGANVTGVDDEGVEAAVARQLMRLGLTLATGESITAGGMGARLVTVPGAGDWFKGGLITYATEAKVVLAGVDEAVLDEHGPVAEQTAAALAVGARSKLGADVGLGVVGVAGPTTQNGKPVGTVCVGVAMPDGSTRTTSRRVPPLGREQIQQVTASWALDYLRRRLVELA